jgi:hypothetical protein
MLKKLVISIFVFCFLFIDLTEGIEVNSKKRQNSVLSFLEEVKADRGTFITEYYIVAIFLKNTEKDYFYEYTEIGRLGNEETWNIFQFFWYKRYYKEYALEIEKIKKEAFLQYPQETASKQRVKYILKETIPYKQSFIFDNWDKINETILNVFNVLKADQHEK